MLGPMYVLAGCCGAFGLFPIIARPVLDRAIWAWTGTGALAGLATVAPLWWVGVLGLLLAGMGAGLAVGLWKRAQAHGIDSAGTWDCGYANPTSRMQYTASSFAEMLVGVFRGILRPREHVPKIDGPCPAESTYASHVDDTVLRGIIRPAWGWIERRLSPLRLLQHGRIQFYLLYILLIVVLLLCL